MWLPGGYGYEDDVIAKAVRLYAEVGTTKLTRTPTESYTTVTGPGGDM
jgi:hypothetical protein